MSGIIPKEEGGTFQRWQIDSFDTPGTAFRRAPAAPAPAPVKTPTPAPKIETPPPIPLPTAEEIERIHEEARDAGYREGYEAGQRAGEEAGQAAAKTQAEEFQRLYENFRQALSVMDQEVAEQLLALSIEIASQVVRGAIAVKQDLLQPIVREAIAALPIHHTHLSLRLNPSDAAKIRPLIGEQLAQSGAQIVEDPEITPGGCLVRAGTSEVDATIETRWKRVLEAIGTNPQEWQTL